MPSDSDNTGPAAAKKQKTYDADGPVEDDETAREKLEEAGFDPDDVHTARSAYDLDERSASERSASDLDYEFFEYDANVTPMTFFSFFGDLPMCRYLHHVRGAVTTRVADEHKSEPDEGVPWFPIIAAAWSENYEIVKYLYRNGAKSDIFRRGLDGCTCISQSFSGFSNVPDAAIALAKWLVMEGVLEDRVGHTDRSRVCRLLVEMQRANSFLARLETQEIIGWLKELIAPNDAFHTFLLGTFPAPQYSVAAMKKLLAERIGSVEAASMLVDAATSNGTTRNIWDQLMTDFGRSRSSNACLASFPGVLEKIGDFVGIMKNKRKLRRIMSAMDLARNVTKREIQALEDAT